MLWKPPINRKVAEIFYASLLIQKTHELSADLLKNGEGLKLPHKKQTGILFILLAISLALIPALAQATENYTFVSELYGSIPGDTNFSSAGNVGVDASGNIFLVSPTDNSIKKFSSEYAPMAFTFGASFNLPVDITFDSSGNIYVSDSTTVREFSSTGTLLSTIGTWGSNQPGCIAIDAQSKVYVTSPLENKVYKFSPSAGSYTVTSWGSSGSGNGEFNTPSGIAVYGGYVYIADEENQRIQKFTDAGVYVSQWSTNIAGLFNYVPTDLAVDSLGNIFVSMTHTSCILKFSNSGSLLATIGTPHAGITIAGRVEGQLNQQLGIAVDGNGYVTVADSGNNRIEKLTDNGVFVSALYSAISGQTTFQECGNVAVDSTGNIYVVDFTNTIKKYSSAYAPLSFTFGSTFNHPAGICIDNSGNIYVSDYSTVRKFSSSGSLLTTICTWSAQPGFIAVDSQSNVYVTSPLENKVYKFSPSGAGYVQATLWGSFGTGDGQLKQPGGIAVYGENVYVADGQNMRIQKFNEDGGYESQWSTNVVGLLNYLPSALAVDSSGNVFVSMSYTSCVLKFSSSGELLATVGTPHADITTEGSAEGQFNQQLGLTTDGSGYLYVADFGNNRIEKFSPPTLENQPSVVLSPASGPSGTDFKVTCSGFAPYTDITVTLPWGFTPYHGKTDENGVLDRLSVIVPTDVDVGPYAITATGTTSSGSASVTAYFTVTPLNSFSFDSISNPQTAGVPFSVKITAKDYQGNTLTSFTGIVTLTCLNKAAISPSVTGHFVNGVWTGNIEIDSAATGITITAKDSSGATGTSNSFNVVPGMVVPEYTFGALAALGACLVGFAVFKKRNNLRL
jgi:sugar lactone lactonase YvrE